MSGTLELVEGRQAAIEKELIPIKEELGLAREEPHSPRKSWRPPGSSVSRWK